MNLASVTRVLMGKKGASVSFHLRGELNKIHLQPRNTLQPRRERKSTDNNNSW